MNYPVYYPTPYFQQPQFQQQVQQSVQPQQQVQQQTPQIQNGGYITVRSEEEARNYPLAPGNSMTFFDETKSYCYKKTMGFSPLDQPTFKRYKIVEEEIAETMQKPEEVDTGLKEEVESIREDVEVLKNKVKTLSSRNNNSSKGGKRYESQSE